MIKIIILFLFAPRFFRDMPSMQSGMFIAGAYKKSPWYSHTPETMEIYGRRRAYVRARWLALKLDWHRASNEVEIIWFVDNV